MTTNESLDMESPASWKIEPPHESPADPIAEQLRSLDTVEMVTPVDDGYWVSFVDGVFVTSTLRDRGFAVEAVVFGENTARLTPIEDGDGGER